MKNQSLKSSSGCRTGLVWLILLLVLYLALHVLSRTAGARSLLEDQIEAATGRRVEIERMRLHWDLALEARGVRTLQGLQPGQPGFEVEALRLHWTPAGFLRGRSWIREAEWIAPRLHLRDEGNGAWQPARLVPLAGDLADRFQMGFVRPDQPLPLLPASMRVSGGEVRWWNAEGREEAFVSGIQAVVTVFRVPGRDPARYVRIEASRARGAATGDAGDLLVEDLTIGDRSYRLEERLPWTGGPDPVGVKPAASLGLD